MNKTLTASLLISTLLIPVITLAEDFDSNDAPPPPGPGVRAAEHIRDRIDMMQGRPPQFEGQGNGGATTTRQDVREEIRDRMREHIASTTPLIPRIMNATATRERIEARLEDNPGVPFFLRWLFGLPATTTVADIRAEIQASTTASTTNPRGEGLGLFRNLFEGIGRFFRSDR